MNSVKKSGALITHDAVVKGVSHITQRYSIGHAKAYEVEMLLTLKDYQRRLVERARANGPEDVHMCGNVRSACAQLKWDNCQQDKTTDFKLKPDGLHITTLTAVHCPKTEDRMWELLRKATGARLSYLFLGPREALIKKEVRVPLQKEAYAFNVEAMERDGRLEDLFAADPRISARRMIEEYRHIVRMPDEIESGEFLICGIETPLVLDEHWLIRPETLHADSAVSDLCHGTSGALHGGRPEVRQGEFININGMSSKVPAFAIIDAYRPSTRK